jgi:hypothetical protein
MASKSTKKYYEDCICSKRREAAGICAVMSLNSPSLNFRGTSRPKRGKLGKHEEYSEDSKCI